jgi:uncharacterized membrane protein YfcA
VWISLVLGAVVGAILGLTGAGGGILAVPALVVGLGWTMQQAAPVALIAVAASAALGAVEGLRRKLVRYKAAVLMACAGVPVTAVGVTVAHALSQRLLLAIFAAVMLIVAVRLLRQAWQPPALVSGTGSAVAQLDPVTGRFAWSWPTAALLGLIGAFTGFMTGLLGVGGGFVIVPMLRRFTAVSVHGIVATSLLVIALVGSGGVVTSLLRGMTVPVATTLSFACATAGGMVVGRLLSRVLSARQVQLGFALVVLLVGLGLLLKSVWSF